MGQLRIVPPPQNISAVLITRGDHDISAVVQSLTDRFFGLVVYNNSTGLDFKVFSRFIAAQNAPSDYVYFQDDDCIVDLSAYPWDLTGNHVLCNMPKEYRKNYPGPTQLLGFGSVIPRSLIVPTFNRYLAYYPLGPMLLRECDRIFTGLNPCRLCNVPITHMPYAMDEDRMYRRPEHNVQRRVAEEQIREILELEKRIREEKEHGGD
jgi:hypothetical protein